MSLFQKGVVSYKAVTVDRTVLQLQVMRKPLLPNEKQRLFQWKRIKSRNYELDAFGMAPCPAADWTPSH